MINEKEYSILLNSEQDYHNFSRLEKITKFSIDHHLIEKFGSKKVKSFLINFPEPNEINSIIGKIINNWHRNEDGKSIYKEVSFPNYIQYRLALKISTALKYYFAFYKNIHFYKKIYVSNKSSEYIRIVSQFFSEKIEFYNGSFEYDMTFSIDPDRGKINNPRIIKFFSFMLRKLQTIFKIKKKALIFNDWTYYKVNNENCLNLNKLNFLKSFYLQPGNNFREKYEKKYPKKINKNKCIKNIEKIIARLNLKQENINELKFIISDIISLEYEKSRDTIINIDCCVEELFDFYSPKIVILPGNAHPFYQAMYSKCLLNKIPTLYITDGFPFIFDKDYFPNDHLNNGNNISYFASFSSDITNLVKKEFNNDAFKIINLKGPILKTKIFPSKYKKKNKALVLFPYPNEQSVSSRWDMRCFDVIEVLRSLMDLSYNHITIKIKPGVDENDGEKFKKIINSYFQDLNSILIEFKYGELKKQIKDNSIIIGGIGASISESYVFGTPYYIYEPLSNGFTSEDINKSYIENNKVARNIKELKKNISTNNYFSVSNLYLEGYPSIEELDYKKLSEYYF